MRLLLFILETLIKFTSLKILLRNIDEIINLIMSVNNMDNLEILKRKAVQIFSVKDLENNID